MMRSEQTPFPYTFQYHRGRMFIGHFAVGFGAKRAEPRISLGTLTLAATFLDLLWPAFLLVGLEHVRIDPGNTRVTALDFYDYPLSHSLIWVLGWSVLVSLLWFSRHRLARPAVIVGAVVASHWVLDFLTHRPDLPILPHGPYVGLGLWNSVAGTILVEVGMFAVAVVAYVRGTRPRDRVGTWALAMFVAVMLGIYAANIFSPPPPSVRAIAWAGLAGGWLTVAWAYWIDRHRQTLPSGQQVQATRL